MTVAQLIKLLKKQNPNAEVCWQALDQSDHECDGWVRCCREAEPSLCEAEGLPLIVVLAP